MHRASRFAHALLSFAAAAVVPQTASALDVQQDRGIPYVTGGVGQDERDTLKAMESQFNLALQFSAQGGAFLSGVRVEILDRSGRTVLDALTEGPFFYASLPPGSYRVTASVEGQSTRRSVTVGAGRITRADFAWR
jgi:Carboxypeptidase regulatory-like domain